MNDIRRTILWVIFGFSMVLLWDQWQVHSGRPATFFPKPGAVSASKAEPASAAVPTPSVVSAASPSQVPANTAAPAALARELIDVSTDIYTLRFDTEGGSLVRAELTQHPDIADPRQAFVLLEESRDRVYVAQTGLIGGQLPTHKSPMRFTGDRTLKDGQDSLNLRFESEVGGVKLVKTYTLKRGSYAIGVKHEVINQSPAPVSPQLYLQLVRDGNKPAGDSSFYSTFTGPAIYTEAKKYHKVEFEDIAKNKAEFDKHADNGYVAMVQHYFASAWLLGQGIARENFVRKVDNNLYAVGVITPLGEVAQGQSKALETTLFAGPQEEKVLEALAPGLDLLKDYGWLAMLAKPLFWLLDQLYKIIHNWGWAIMALVLLLKIAFYWLNAKAYASMAKMKAINPRIMDMRERLKDNPQQMQMEMMKIYREEKVNPMGGCFPMLIQIPVFIALYWVLLSTVEMRHAPWIGWITDLSVKDPYYILPVVMTLTTLLQTALNPAPPDPMQAKLMWIMPLAFSV
ncbi:MAG: membrane protein insertase YidC, partial [Betaproteobacteria bacterium]|nr:membrane protein insertase YidC [Betaproteobacteria bacterium]